MLIYYSRLAWLSIRRTPVISALMVLAIAVGVGLTMTSLSVNHMMSVNPIAHKSKQLFAVQLENLDKDANTNQEDGLMFQMTYQDAMGLRRGSNDFRQAAMFKTGYAVQTDNPEIPPELLKTRATDRDFFAMFDVPFLHGDVWDKSVDESGVHQVVIADALNRKLFGGGNNVGKEILLDQKPFRIVGIIADWHPQPLFYDLNNADFTPQEQLFVPFSLIPLDEPVSWGNTNGWKGENIDGYQGFLQSENHWIQFWVELENEQQKADYQAFMQSYIQQQKRLGRFERDNPRGELKDVERWLEYNQVVSDDSSVLVGLSFLFLAVCLVNTIGLLLSKFLRRAPEVGVRRALGATRSQVFAQHLVEVSLLGVVGGLLGIGLAQLGLLLIRSTSSNYVDLAQMDLAMLLAAPAIAIAASILAGLFPAWQICRTQPSIYLKTQ